MPTTLAPFDPPIFPGISCRHCGEQICATAEVRRGLSISGLREFTWVHENGSEHCQLPRTAQPFDGWKATTAVEKAVQERRDAEDAAMDAEEALSE